MAWYQVAYLPTVTNDLRLIDTLTAQRLLDKTKWLASNIDNLRHQPLSCIPDISQYAVGNWRILYAIDRQEHVVDIHRIATRKELYRSRSF